jgi:hypothetical protein
VEECLHLVRRLSKKEMLELPLHDWDSDESIACKLLCIVYANNSNYATVVAIQQEFIEEHGMYYEKAVRLGEFERLKSSDSRIEITFLNDKIIRLEIPHVVMLARIVNGDLHIS